MSLDTALHIATSALMFVFGLGAWRARRESAEVVTAADIGRLAKSVQDLDSALSRKVSWKDFDRDRDNFRREVTLQVEPVCDRVERLERKVFNGGAG